MFIKKRFFAYPCIPHGISNTLHVAWFGYITTTVPVLYEVQYKQNAGSGWSANPINLSNTQYDSVNVGLASAGANIYLVWNDKQTGNTEILFKRSTDNGTILRLRSGQALGYESRSATAHTSGSPRTAKGRRWEVKQVARGRKRIEPEPVTSGARIVPTRIGSSVREG